MTISNRISIATRITFDDQFFYVDFADGRKLSVPLAYFPRLMRATSEQRQTYFIAGGGTSLHWEELDEDIGVENLLLGFGDTSHQDSPPQNAEAA
ncbi:MAG: DUF2442 domain-containing protein [bacterium]